MKSRTLKSCLLVTLLSIPALHAQTTFTVTAAPEAATDVLFGVGVLALAIIYRRGGS